MYRRLALSALLLAALAGSLVAFGSLGHSPAEWRFPDSDDVVDAPDAYVGDRVVVYGRVVSTSPLRLDVIPVDGKDVYQIEGANQSVERGVDLEVYGVLRPDGRIDALGVVVFRAGGVQYAYGVSALAGLWVLARSLRAWDVDADAAAFVPRDRVRSLRRLVRREEE